MSQVNWTGLTCFDVFSDWTIISTAPAASKILLISNEVKSNKKNQPRLCRKPGYNSYYLPISKKQSITSQWTVKSWCQFYQHFKSSFFFNVIARKKYKPALQVQKICLYNAHSRSTISKLVKLIFVAYFTSNVFFQKSTNI